MPIEINFFFNFNDEIEIRLKSNYINTSVR